MGSSGSGKSTITKLLLKYYEPESGTISVGGVELDEYSNASVRRAIAYVPQNVELFSKTIYDNIRISRPEASLDEVKAAAKKADAHEFIRKLPLQYNTYLEEAGNGLSGGEKQRLALARAFLKDANLYILDESTSSLDFGTENTIFDMIYNQLADRSMLIVAHRLSTIRDCDLILVMDHGEIVERGTHEELLEKQGKYYELWSLQQGIFRDKKRTDEARSPRFRRQGGGGRGGWRVHHLLIRCSRVRTRLHKWLFFRMRIWDFGRLNLFFNHLKGVIHYDDACKLYCC